MNPIKKDFIQKRDNFRVNISNQIESSASIDDSNQFLFKIKNISLGGCNLTIHHSHLNLSFLKTYTLHSPVNLKVKLLNFEAENIIGVIRNINIDSKHNLVSIGISFEKLKSDEINELQRAIFKIERHYRIPA